MFVTAEYLFIYIYTICIHACFGVYASSVQLCTHPGTWRFVFIHMRVLSPDACGTTRPRQRTQTCAECHGAIVLKVPPGK